MIAITRDLARRFRAIAKKCLAGRPRGPAPAVVCQVRADTLSLWTRTESAGLLYAAPFQGKDATLVVSMSLFESIEGPGTEAVEVSVDRKLQGTAKWLDRGVPQSHTFVALMPGKQHAIPDRPEIMTPVPDEFRTALHECGRTAARDAGRFVLNHLQVRGKSGQVIATDSKRALVWGGFVFPFGGDVLIPAIPAFGCRELASEEGISVGHSPTDLVVACGPWSVHLPVHTTGKYPDVSQILPKPGVGTMARLEEAEAAELLQVLPSLPGAKEENHPVTLDLDGNLTVRARDEATGLVRELSTRTAITGEPSVAAVDRTAIQRALTLGCRTIRIQPVTRTLAFEGPNRIFLIAALDNDAIVPPDRRTKPRLSEFPRSIPVRTPENGHASNGRHHPPPESEPEILDPLAEAEALRVLVVEVGSRLGRLIAALRSTRKEKKVLANVWAGLKQLNLAGGSS